MKRTNNFDALRLIFASLVVLAHTNHLSGNGIRFPVFTLSESAVAGFFLITGYVIAGSAEASSSIGSYFVRRALRIYPAYLFVLLAQVVLLLALARQPVAASAIVKYLAANAVFLNWLQPSFGDGIPGPGAAINGSLWTLKIEVVFYLAAPFLVMLTRRWGMVALILLFTASVAFNLGTSWLGYDRFAKQAPGMLYLFIIGMMMHRFQGRSGGAAIRWWSVAMALLAALMVFEYIGDAGTGDTIEYSLLRVAKLASLTAFVFIFAFKVPPMRVGLDVSYGIYLWHFPIIQTLLVCGLAMAPFWMLLACVCSLTLVAGFVSAIGVERQGIKLGRLLTRRLEDYRRHVGAGHERQMKIEG